MTNLPRMDISMPVAPAPQIADVRPRVDSVQGVSPVTEQVPVSARTATTDNQSKGNDTGTGGAANPQVQLQMPAQPTAPVASSSTILSDASHVSYYDKEAQTIVRQMVDEKTGKVVASYPDQAALARIARLREELGKMVDKKA
jgi:uncharacterized FlaG/YvyC family protein